MSRDQTTTPGTPRPTLFDKCVHIAILHTMLLGKSTIVTAVSVFTPKLASLFRYWVGCNEPYSEPKDFCQSTYYGIFD